MLTFVSTPTITLSASQARRQQRQLLRAVERTGAIVLVTSRKRFTHMLLPMAVARGRGIAISRCGRPVAALISLNDDTDLWQYMRSSRSPTSPSSPTSLPTSLCATA